MRADLRDLWKRFQGLDRSPPRAATDALAELNDLLAEAYGWDSLEEDSP
jgi:hypothetical protein